MAERRVERTCKRGAVRNATEEWAIGTTFYSTGETPKNAKEQEGRAGQQSARCSSSNEMQEALNVRNRCVGWWARRSHVHKWGLR